MPARRDSNPRRDESLTRLSSGRFQPLSHTPTWRASLRKPAHDGTSSVLRRCVLARPHQGGGGWGGGAKGGGGGGLGLRAEATAMMTATTAPTTMSIPKKRRRFGTSTVVIRRSYAALARLHLHSPETAVVSSAARAAEIWTTRLR